jgi:hypothetical protein
MLPLAISSILNKVTGINRGKFVMNPNLAINMKTMVRPNDGYGGLGDKFMEATNAMKALNFLLRASGFTKASCTRLYHALSTGGITEDGKLIPSTVKDGAPMGDLGLGVWTGASSVAPNHVAQSLTLDGIIMSPIKATPSLVCNVCTQHGADRSVGQPHVVDTIIMRITLTHDGQTSASSAHCDHPHVR